MMRVVPSSAIFVMSSFAVKQVRRRADCDWIVHLQSVFCIYLVSVFSVELAVVEVKVFHDYINALPGP